MGWQTYITLMGVLSFSEHWAGLPETALAAILWAVPVPAHAVILAHWRLDSDPSDTQGTYNGTLVRNDYRWASNDFVAETGSRRLNSNDLSSSYSDAIGLQFATTDFSVLYWVNNMQLGNNYLDVWMTATHITLPSNPYRFSDGSASGQPRRFYQAAFGP